MTARTGFLATMSMAVMTVVPSLAAAQPRLIHLPVSVGQSIRVTSADGETVDGKVRSVAPAAMELEADGVRTTMAVEDVKEIRVHDSVGDGVVKGIVFALPVALLLKGAADTLDGLIENTGANVSGGSGIGVMAAIVGAGGLIGGLMDASRLTTVYTRRDGGMTLSVRPFTSATGEGVGIRLRW